MVHWILSLLFATQVFGFGMDRKPPATLALIAGQMAIFVNRLPKLFPTLDNVCLSPLMVYHNKEWRRLILGALNHGSERHLFLNMMSLLYKGILLERQFGTVYFVYLVSIFTALTGVTHIGLELLLGDISSCSVGFSGVLFAITVVTTQYFPNEPSRLFGIIPVPSKHIYWAELFFLQMLVPNSSFIGHLAGILVGLAYVWGPLRFLMDIFLQPTDQSTQPQTSANTQRSTGHRYRFIYSLSVYDDA